MIRPAKSSDKDEILSFCTHTFSWGDYIDQVWDMWKQDKNGQLLVAESGGRRVGMAHAALCPGKRQVWLEGIRVHPDYRRSGIATGLIESMIRYGITGGAREALAVVETDNAGSQRMMEKNGFDIISEWHSFGAGGVLAGQSTARTAAASDLNHIWQYLRGSKVYRRSAKTYVNAWRWYPLDRRAVRRLVQEQRVIITGDPIGGMAVINKSGYWKRKNVLQVVYLDSTSSDSLRHLVSFAANLYVKKKFEKLHILCHSSLASGVKGLKAKESGHFLLYNKALFTR